MLDRKMAALRDEIAEQAATAALLHKFNSGVSEPTGEVTHQRILQGITATREVRRAALSAVIKRLVDVCVRQDMDLASQQSSTARTMIDVRNLELLCGSPGFTAIPADAARCMHCWVGV